MGMRGRVTIALVSSCLWIGLVAPASRAAFPGGDGVIAFSYEAPVPGEHRTQSDVWTIDPGGTDLTQLTDTPHRNEFAPQWNADGTKLAFWRTKTPIGPGSIWVMDADGTDQIRLTDGMTPATRRGRPTASGSPSAGAGKRDRPTSSRCEPPTAAAAGWFHRGPPLRSNPRGHPMDERSR
jgi:hypothetical protein